MIRKPFLLKLYEPASMQRWNDQIRPVDLTELDKQAHKMIIAFVLGKLEQNNGNEDLDWIEIIEAGLFEYLQRTVLTDLKPQLFHTIKEDWPKYVRLNEWVHERICPIIEPLGPDICERFKSYLLSKERNVNRRIISAAHFYATKWEFDIIERANPHGYEIEEIREDIRKKQEKYHNLKSMQQFLKSQNLKDFIDICAQLRFQIRWSHLHRVPKTSVLGHMLIVAMISYVLSLQSKTSPETCVNNYFTGLFHDLPEVLTRDIINPVKGSVEGLRDLIKEYEKQEMERKIYKLLPEAWHEQMRMYTEDEFVDLKDREGKLVKAVDRLTAFIEVYLSEKNGIQNEDLESAKFSLLEEFKGEIIADINFGQIYKDFS